MLVKVLLIYLCCLFSKGKCACTFSSTLQYVWKSSNFGTITINATHVILETQTFYINGIQANVPYACDQSSGTTYVVKSDQFSHLGQEGRAYICFGFTQVNANSYYFYMKSDTNAGFSNERISFWATVDITATVPSLSQICSATPSTAEFISMIRLNSGSDGSEIKTNCIDPLLGNFTYEMTTTNGASITCSNTEMNVCDDRQTIRFDYSSCITKALFSGDGVLGCVSAHLEGTTYYAGLYNYDATPNNLNTFQFICVAVETVGSTVKMTSNPKRCDASQGATARPSTGELYTLTATLTCPFTDEPSANVVAIVLGVIFGLLFIILLIILIWWCCKKKKKRDAEKAKVQRNLKVFEKKMAMDEFDDEHPLNESSLVPDFPQNGFPEPLKISPRSKRYMPQVADVEIQTDRSSLISDREKEFGSLSNRGLGMKKDFHNSNRSLATQKDFEVQTDNFSPLQSTVISHNKTLKNKILVKQEKQPFPSEPQYLPWPWRTANRAMKSSSVSLKTGPSSFKSFNSSFMPDLGEYTIKNYGIKYDDTLSTMTGHPPPRRPLSRANSVYNLSRPPTRMFEMKKAYSQENVNRAKTALGHFPLHQTVKPRLSRSVSHNDVTNINTRNNKISPHNQFLHKPPSKPNVPSRRASVATVKSMLHRNNARHLKTISESKERIPTPLKLKRKPPIPRYMRPLSRSKTTHATPRPLQKAANIYGARPSTVKLKEHARSLLQLKLKQKSMELPRKKRKRFRKKKSSWKSPYALPSSIQHRPLSLRSLSKIANSKVEPIKSNRISARLNDSLTSRDFTTTDEHTSDSNGENFMDAEILKLPPVNKQPVPVREKTYRMDKKRIVSEDSGISADESPTEKAKDNDDNMMFKVKEVIDKGKFKLVTPRSFASPKKIIVPFHLPDYLK